MRRKLVSKFRMLNREASQRRALVRAGQCEGGRFVLRQIWSRILPAMLLVAGCTLNSPRDTEIGPDGTSTLGDANESRVEQLSSATQTLGQSAAILDELRISLVRISGGLFQMGSSAPERYGAMSQCEAPRHAVRISRSFGISRHEITVGQFRRFVDATEYESEAEHSGQGCNGLDLSTGGVVRRSECVWSSPGFAQSDLHPVVCVSWNDAWAFCRWLSETSGLTCRLPTEGEWEYCCRAGTETTFSTGDAFESLQQAANCGDQALHAACVFLTATATWNDGCAFTAPVGTFQPNGFGLYDMHGNVGEWCLDWFDADYYSRSPETDPRGPETTQQWHVVRGGSWFNNPASCRSSGRHDSIPTAASTTNGFRIVVEIAATADK